MGRAQDTLRIVFVCILSYKDLECATMRYNKLWRAAPFNRDLQQAQVDFCYESHSPLSVIFGILIWFKTPFELFLSSLFPVTRSMSMKLSFS